MATISIKSLVLLSIVGISTLSTVVSATDATAKIKVLNPDDLRNKFHELKSTLTVGNFGNVPWGRTLIGNLHYAQPADACSALSPIIVEGNGSSFNSMEGESPILVADRGNCTFVMKALNAQNIGAKLLIVVDNLKEDENFILPVDDGHGGSLHIPLILIDIETGQLFEKYLNESKEVVVSVKFDMPKSYEVINYEIWLSSSDAFSFDLVKDLYKYQDILGDKAVMTPHYAVWYCPVCEIFGFNDTTNVNCLSGGRYCSPDPDGTGPLTGRDTLMEDLRQICIFKEGRKYWWDYHNQFSKSCLNAEKLEECSYNAIKNIKLDKSKIEGCVNKSFNGDNNLAASNKILADERDIFLKRGILTWPSIVINNMTYRGNLEPASYIFEAMCEGFTNQIPECDDSNTTPFPSGGDITSKAKLPRKSKSHLASILAIIGLAVLVFIIIFLCYKRQVKREILQEMNNQIASTMQRYIAMKDESEGIADKKNVFVIDNADA